MKKKMFIIIFCIVFIIFYYTAKISVADVTVEQKLKNTAKIAEILLKWEHGKLIITESLQGTIIEESSRNSKKLIPFALLVYRNNNAKWKITLNKKTFQQWQDFLIKQKGEWPEEGIIIIITDKEEFPTNIPLNVPAFTQTFGIPKEKFTITAISTTRIQKQKLRPANFSDKILFEAITATEICNIMFIKLHGEERDRLCVSLGMAVGSIKTNLDYRQYQEKISKVKILSGIAPLIFPEYDYWKLRDLFSEGPIIKFQQLK